MANFFSKIFGEDEDFIDYEQDDGFDTSSSAVTEEEADYMPSYSEPHNGYTAPKTISLHNALDAPKLYIMKPSGYDEVMTGAVDMLREGTIIFLNLNGIDQEVGTRIVDFMTGVAAAFEGRIKKVDTCCYAVAPKNVDWISTIDD